MLVVAILCCNLGFLAALKFKLFDEIELWDRSDHISILFHSINLTSSGNYLYRVLSSSNFPFKAIYDNGCKDFLTRTRFEELKSLAEYQSLLLSPQCLSASSLIIEQNDLPDLSVDLLESNEYLSRLTMEASMTLLDRVLTSNDLPFHGCNPIMTLAHKVRRKPKEFWLLVHPLCFLNNNRDWTNRESDRHSLLLDNLFNAINLEDCLRDGEMAIFMRWIVKVSLIGMILTRSYDEREIGWLNQIVVDIITVIDMKLSSISAQSSSNSDLHILIQARQLIMETKKFMFCVKTPRDGRSEATFPDYSTIWSIISDKPATNGYLNHLEITLISIYLLAYPHLVPDLDGKLEALKVKSLWPIDVVYLLRLQIQPICYSEIHKKSSLMPLLLERMTSSAYLQEALLGWIARKSHRCMIQYGDDTSPIKDLARIIPISNRLRFIRKIWSMNKDPDMQWTMRNEPGLMVSDLTPTSEIIRDYFKYLQSSNRLVATNDGFMVTIESSEQAEWFGSMCAQLIIFRIHLPIPIDKEQLRMLLIFGDHLSLTELEIERLFPIRDGSRTSRRQLFGDFRNDCIRLSQFAFQTNIPLSKLFLPEELLNILI